LMSLALLEDDGGFMIFGYLTGVSCVVFYGLLFMYGTRAVLGLWALLGYFFA